MGGRWASLLRSLTLLPSHGSTAYCAPTSWAARLAAAHLAAACLASSSLHAPSENRGPSNPQPHLHLHPSSPRLTATPSPQPHPPSRPPTPPSPPSTPHPSPLTPSPLTRCGATLGCTFAASSKSTVANTTCVKCKTTLKIRVPPSAPLSVPPSGRQPAGRPPASRQSADRQPAQLSGRAYPGGARRTEEPLVEEARGWQLHLSSSSKTGYKGVGFQHKEGGKSKPSYQAALGGTYIGSYSTAVEAAVAYARAEAEQQGEDEEEDEDEEQGDGEVPLVQEAGGWQLHLSSSKTGYTGVVKCSLGPRFQAVCRRVHLGNFDTAVAAAVAFARAAAREAASGGAPLTSHADVEPSATSEPRLLLSAHNQTGYKGVQPDGQGFHAATQIGGRWQNLGNFTTARGAAVAYSRAFAAGARPPSRGAASAQPPVRSSLLGGTFYRREVRIGAGYQAEVPSLP